MFNDGKELWSRLVQDDPSVTSVVQPVGQRLYRRMEKKEEIVCAVAGCALPGKKAGGALVFQLQVELPEDSGEPRINKVVHSWERWQEQELRFIRKVDPGTIMCETNEGKIFLLPPPPVPCDTDIVFQELETASGPVVIDGVVSCAKGGELIMLEKTMGRLWCV